MENNKPGTMRPVRWDVLGTAFLTQGDSSDFRLHKEQGGGGIYDVGCCCISCPVMSSFAMICAFPSLT